MRKPYRVIVWGPGAIGGACIRELIRRPEFDIAGVLAYSPEKEGVDVGTLVDLPPIGVKATTDVGQILATPADCVLYCGSFPAVPAMAEEMDANIIRLLESGKNVVTPVAMHYVSSPSQGPVYLKRFEDACHKGGSTLHGTGENPGFWFERVATTLTGVCNDVDYITLDEYADCRRNGSVEVLNALGFGVSEEQASRTADALTALWQRYHFIETLNFVSKSLFGRHLDRFEVSPVYYIADQDYVFSRENGDTVNMVIKAGQVKAMTYNLCGYIDGELRLRDSVNWFMKPETSPFEGKVDSMWDIEIEGKPTSLRCSIQAKASFRHDLECYPGDPTTPTWYATITPMIQAIPIVCSRKPGIVYPSVFTSCVSDFRLLETRASLVD